MTRYGRARKWLNDVRIKVGYAILPEYRRCGCTVKPFPMYSLTCRVHNPRGVDDARRWAKHNPEYSRGVRDGRRIERHS